VESSFKGEDIETYREIEQLSRKITEAKNPLSEQQMKDLAANTENIGIAALKLSDKQICQDKVETAKKKCKDMRRFRVNKKNATVDKCEFSCNQALNAICDGLDAVACEATPCKISVDETVRLLGDCFTKEECKTFRERHGQSGTVGAGHGGGAPARNGTNVEVSRQVDRQAGSDVRTQASGLDDVRSQPVDALESPAESSGQRDAQGSGQLKSDASTDEAATPADSGPAAGNEAQGPDGNKGATQGTAQTDGSAGAATVRGSGEGQGSDAVGDNL
jgi:hypothetical protein